MSNFTNLGVKNGRAISTSIAAIMVIVIVVAAAGVYLVALSHTSTSPLSSASSSRSTAIPMASTQQTATTSVSSSHSSSSSSAGVSSSSTQASSSPSAGVTFPLLALAPSSSCTATTANNESAATSIASIEDEMMGFVIPLFQNLRAMTIELNMTDVGNETYAGATTHYNETTTGSYSFLVTSAQTSGGLTAYVVNMTGTTKSGTETAVATVLSNGTVTAIETYVNGNSTSYPSLEAEGYFILLVLPYELDYAAAAAVPSTAFNVTRTSGPVSETFGPTTIPVYTYSDNSLPLQTNSCGFTWTLTAFSLQAGAVPGTSLTVATSANIAEESQGTSLGLSLGISLVVSVNLVSVTRA